MNLKIRIKKRAQKFIEKQSIDQQRRLLKAIYAIPSGDIKKLTGKPHTNGLLIVLRIYLYESRLSRY